MVSQKVTVMNASGLHARPANAFVKEAVRHAGCNILIKKDGKTYMVTASSLRVRSGAGTNFSQIGSLKNGATVKVESIANGVKCGTEIELVADGTDEAQALQDMVSAVNSGLGE